MDLNYLLAREQVALFYAENAASDEARRVHQLMADSYAARIAGSKFPPRPALRVG